MNYYGSTGAYIARIPGDDKGGYYYLRSFDADSNHISWTSKRCNAARFSEHTIQEAQKYLDDWYGSDSPYIIKERVD